jgi:hypothetical protein
LRNLPLIAANDGSGNRRDSNIQSNAPDNNVMPTPSDADDSVLPEVSSLSILKPTEQNRVDYLSPSLATSGSKMTAMIANAAGEHNNAPSSEAMAASLLLAASVARKRGWNIVRSSEEEAVIYGDLQDLRKMQSSRKFEVWEKQDMTTKH